ncbi:hypothetical protein T439DRAFT_298654 [Meredithblackwellia eburnea MCA 4105]
MSVSLQRRRSRQSVDIPLLEASTSTAVHESHFSGFSSALAPSPRLKQGPFSRVNKYLPRWMATGLSYRHIGLGLVVFGILALVRNFLNRPKPLPPQTCNAMDKPGRLLLNLTSPLHTHWRPLDETACPALPSYLPGLWKLSKGENTPFPAYEINTYSKEYQFLEGDPVPRHSLPVGDGPSDPADPVAWLRKLKRKKDSPPTVLVIGDSVDRNGLVHFCQLLHQNVTISLYEDMHSHPPPTPDIVDLTKGHGPKYKGWDQRGLPHMCEIPFHPTSGQSGTALRVVNGFHYGMDALDEFDTPDHLDWHKPGRIENRINDLVVPFVEQIGGPKKIDLVLLHSGMWDLALFGMQDDKTKWSLSVPLTPEQLAWWQERMRHTIFHVRQHFPHSRLVMRKLHRTDDQVQGTQYITNRRVHQLRHLQEEVARVEGLPTFDYGRMLEGYQLFQEKVHPLLLPGGVMYGTNLMHQLKLALAGYRD